MADRDEDENDDDRSSEPPESKARSKRDQDDAEDEEEAPRPRKKALAKNTRKRASDDKPKAKPKERQKEPPKEPEPSSSNNLVWVALLAVVALGAWWIFRGQNGAKEEHATAHSETPTTQAAPKIEQPAGGTHEPAPEPEPQTEAPSASAAPAASAPTAPTAGGSGGSFDRGLALDALAKSGAKAAGCRMRGESAGTANVTVTFEPSGKVKSAEIRSGTFSGSGTGKCIVRKLLETTIAPFSGEPGQVIAPVSVR